MNALSMADRAAIDKAPRIWVSYPDGRRMRIIDPDFVARMKRKHKTRVLPDREVPTPVKREIIYVQRTTGKAIITSVAYATGVPVQSILGSDRVWRTVRARNLAMYLCRLRLRMTLSQIGLRFGKDHTTVLHGIRKHIATRRALGRRLPDAEA